MDYLHAEDALYDGARDCATGEIVKHYSGTGSSSDDSSDEEELVKWADASHSENEDWTVELPRSPHNNMIRQVKHVRRVLKSSVGGQEKVCPVRPIRFPATTIPRPFVDADALCGIPDSCIGAFLSPGLANRFREMTLKTLLTRVQIALIGGDFNHAEDLARAAGGVALDMNDRRLMAKASYWHGMAMMRLNDYEEAVADFRMAAYAKGYYIEGHEAAHRISEIESILNRRLSKGPRIGANPVSKWKGAKTAQLKHIRLPSSMRGVQPSPVGIEFDVTGGETAFMPSKPSKYLEVELADEQYWTADTDDDRSSRGRSPYDADSEQTKSSCTTESEPSSPDVKPAQHDSSTARRSSSSESSIKKPQPKSILGLNSGKKPLSRAASLSKRFGLGRVDTVDVLKDEDPISPKCQIRKFKFPASQTEG